MLKKLTIYLNSNLLSSCNLSEKHLLLLKILSLSRGGRGLEGDVEQIMERIMGILGETSCFETWFFLLTQAFIPQFLSFYSKPGSALGAKDVTGKSGERQVPNDFTHMWRIRTKEN